jgi:fatty acid desaturase
MALENLDVLSGTAEAPTGSDYAELRRIIKDKGLLNKQPAYYAYKFIFTLGLLAASIAFLALVDNFWWQLLNAAFLALVFGQIGYVGHDAGHRGIFKSARLNELTGLGVNFLISLSRTWWVTQHNQHHSTPNDLDQDPHTLIPVMAFSQEKAMEKRGFLAFAVRYQAFYYPPLLMLEGLGIRFASFQFLFRTRKAKYFVIEPTLMALHFVAYFGLLFYLFSPIQVLLFAAVHQGFFGLYYGLIFAPNHKGMLIVGKNNPLDFLRTQVLTTRNVKPSLWTDFMYGGLNYQIEHHLFPIMPRNNLGKARKIVMDFCRRRGVDYHETSTLQSYREILASLHQASAPLRRGNSKAVA